MTDTTAGIPRRPSKALEFVKGILLLRESIVGMIGAFLVLFWLFVAIFANVIAPFNPNQPLVPLAAPGTEFVAAATQQVASKPASEVCSQIYENGTATDQYDCGTFWLGTDHIGRDILSRIIFGSRTVLIYAPLATFCAYFVGVPMGLAAGYRRGMTDGILSFIANVILSFPVLVLYVIIIAFFGASAFNIVVAVTFASAPGIMRIVRGLVLDLRNREYVFAAETRGEPGWRIMLIEILPNARGPLIVDSCVRVGYVIITIGVLGFLGLGLPPPNPDWGGMINETRQMAMTFPHMTVFPCIAISSLVLGFNLLADGMREVSLRD
ncbi:MAG TPA: ABC transporter permease [Kiloniellaceae bacterium]|nr:ABC transporter permease [Kiloniellaceae bacterium]